MSSTFIPNQKGIDFVVNSPRGPVGKYIRRKAIMIKIAARAQVGVNTGALRSSIHLRHKRDIRGQYIQVGSNLPYARMHHEGTRPHVIVPNKGRALRFFVKGAVVFTHRVMHPGTRPNRYLSDQLRLVK